MDKLTRIAWREYYATVRTKAFILSVVLLPAIVVAGVYGTQYAEKLASSEKVPDRTLAVVDHTGRLYEPLAAIVDAWNQNKPNQRFLLEQVPAEPDDTAALRQRVNQGEIYAYIILPADVIAGEGQVEIARRDKQLDAGRRMETFINGAVSMVRFQDLEIDPVKVAAARREVTILEVDPATAQARKSNIVARLLTPFAFMFLLFMGTFGISQGLLTSLIEEKSNRVIEVLLSAVSPMQLMVGKILGNAAVGATLLIVWGSVGYYGAQRFHVPELVGTQQLVLALMYFLPGFLFMAALLAGVGSMCNELKDAQGMMFPVSIITIIPMIFWFYLAQYPQSAVSIALSYVPPITPLVMILRICADPDTPLWQIVTTLALLWVCVLGMFWAAAKVFRLGVLMYGKAPTLPEIIRAVRMS
ncbi:MAG: ABC transporter permease [Phycisphaerales bacterium]|nr:ABC transporter permease [Phycisphaerales bacterium]